MTQHLLYSGPGWSEYCDGKEHYKSVRGVREYRDVRACPDDCEYNADRIQSRLADQAIEDRRERERG